MGPDPSEPATGSPVPGPTAWKRFRRALRKRSGAVLLALICVTALLVALVLWTTLRTETPQAPPVDVEATVAEMLASQVQGPAVSALVYQAILPSLVLVQSDKFDASDRDVFGLGSGVVINQDGSVLTSYHVVEGSREIQLAYADGTRTVAYLENVDRDRDIAVLVPATAPGLVVPATMGNPSAMRVGDEVFAVGNPLGLVGSLSAGVVSGMDRQSTPHGRDEPVRGLIQFDAAVNPGNSGGPLLNTSGQVVGIVVGLMNPTEQDVFIGIGFAVPIDVAAGAAGGPAQ